MSTQAETARIASKARSGAMSTDWKLIFAGALLFLAFAMVGFSMIVGPALSGRGGDTTEITYVGP